MSDVMQAGSVEGFDRAVESGVTLVDFWAPWCGPCRAQLPVLEKLVTRLGSGAKVLKVNVDDLPELAARFGVRGIPTLLVLRDGALMEQFVGMQSEDTLAQAVEAHLAPSRSASV